MTVKMTASDAAAHIADSGLLEKEHVDPTPEERHFEVFVEKVAGHLSLDISLFRARIEKLLKKLGIEPDHDHEYPKWVDTGKKDDAGKPVMACANDADEEADIKSGGDGKKPEDPKPEDKPPSEVKPSSSGEGFLSAGSGRLQPPPQRRP